MSEEGKKAHHHHHHHHHQQPEEQQPQYGTFQGVANYPPPEPAVGFPQPVPPPGVTGQYGHGYQTVPGYAVAEGRPVTGHGRLPCCGLGFGWFLFILGFFLGSIPWYIGAVILLCVKPVDHREKPGYVACSIGSVIAIIAIVFGASRL